MVAPKNSSLRRPVTVVGRLAWETLPSRPYRRGLRLADGGTAAGLPYGLRRSASNPVACPIRGAPHALSLRHHCECGGREGISRVPTSMELFTGAGGLALGLHRAGFKHLLLVEHSSKACATLRHNFRRSLRGGGCELHDGDVRDVRFGWFAGEVDVLAAGASCQPFSIGGLHRAHVDDRNVFPAVFRAQREAGPKAVIVENVKGLVRTGFSDYVRYIELQLAMPELPAPDDDGPEAWRRHLPKLLRASRGSRRVQGRVRYLVRRVLMNAADYGIGQHRERVFFVALRADLRRAWEPPAATHGRDRLLFDQYVSGAYWKRHELDARREPSHLRSRIKELTSPQI